MDVAHKHNLPEKLREFPGVIVYGELFGAGVQSLRYGLDNDWDLRVFDIYLCDEDRYANFDEMLEWCEKFGLPTVPLLYRGAFSADTLAQWTTGRSATALRLGGDHITEGVVVKPATERWDFDNGLGRVILKSINPDYLLKKLD
jgi:RNA ligase (TIGR02306 family)